jgi:hypothetical protein
MSGSEYVGSHRDDEKELVTAEELAVNHFHPDHYSYRLQLRRANPAGAGPGSR